MHSESTRYRKKSSIFVLQVCNSQLYALGQLRVGNLALTRTKAKLVMCECTFIVTITYSCGYAFIWLLGLLVRLLN